jgi:hypothetical protein
MAGAKMCFSAFGLILIMFFGGQIKDAVARDQAQFPDQAQMVDEVGREKNHDSNMLLIS